MYKHSNISRRIDTLFPLLDVKALAAIKPYAKTLEIAETKSDILQYETCIEYLSETGENHEEMNETVVATRFRRGLEKLRQRGLVDATGMGHFKASSTKEGYPIVSVMDGDPNTYWQSDGSQPHTIDVYFSKRVEIACIALFFSLFLDESYSPQIFEIYAGHGPSDATHYKTLHIGEINQWIALSFEDSRPDDRLLMCQFIRFVIPTNHENGKDTHLRGLKLFAASAGDPLQALDIRRPDLTISLNETVLR
ncbi:LAMI_0D01882g1_1 [Lachancea mirantina]|uniref:LAMI_0D01882g1_1 n=1 Tax=Lachancea mirantina TaxID=1230905 RepID=A0A1G4J8V3_9SACH|nr:LAMI_0D01882g1_1 [Lachancea mirantina]